MKIEIIGEIGECFNGDLDRAKKMIVQIKNAGCDVVKFQIIDMEEVASNDPEYEWFSRLELSIKNLKELLICAKKVGIDILFTPVSVKTASWIYDLGCRQVKIASSFINKLDLIKYINEHFDKVYLSTGMAELSEIRNVIKNLFMIKKIIILHCISEYPTGPLLDQRGLCALDEKDAHLSMIDILKNQFPEHSIGYSDHTSGIFVPVIAAAMGAEVIEKHVTLDRETPIRNFQQNLEYLGTDHILSVLPDELHEMSSLIRRVEDIKGENKWYRSEGEKVLLQFLRGRYEKGVKVDG